MFIRKNISSLIVDSHATVLSALKKIEQNKRKIVYIVDKHNRLIGSFADGDFRRSLIAQEKCDLNTTVDFFVNTKCTSLPIDSEPSVIELALKSNNISIPLVDTDNHIIAVAESGAKFFEVSDRRISEEDPAFIIAEIGNNHQGCVRTAKKLVELAADAGVDCVKFQMRDMKVLYGESSVDGHDLGSQYTLDLLKKYQLTNEQMFEVFDHCKEHRVIPLCTPWDTSSLGTLETYGFDAYKVSSADFTNYQLLTELAATGKLMICSTGMSTEHEIRSTVKFLEQHKASFILLHCNSTYPTPLKDINLKYLSTLKNISNTVVGYSGHERGWSIPVAAVAMGAKVIEKHFTLDKSQEGNDHKVSLLPSELSQMVHDIRAVEEALGHDHYRELTQGELINRQVLAKSVYAIRNMVPGEVVNKEDVYVRAPGNGIQPNRLHHLLGKRIQRVILKDEAFRESDISGILKKKNIYTFNRPVGIPVRYHDYRELTREVKLDFVEFHLSYADMEQDLAKHLDFDAQMGLAVHAPELFPNDHLLDLASFDKDYRKQSIVYLERVVAHTHQLKSFFPKTASPVIVVNVGGWNSNRFLSREEVLEKYQLVKSSLRQVDQSGVKLAIQTMPPFPWHFGGQSHHSLFVTADDCVNFCAESDVSICLDLSHSMMACNYYGHSIYEFVEKVAPYTSHFHIADAKGVDGEGIQIGRGDIDFKRIGKIIDDNAPGVQFIPEIWQGHNNNGEGFWNALAYLESKFN